MAKKRKPAPSTSHSNLAKSPPGAKYKSPIHKGHASPRKHSGRGR